MHSHCRWYISKNSVFFFLYFLDSALSFSVDSGIEFFSSSFKDFNQLPIALSALLTGFKTMQS